MNKIFYALLSVLALASCGNTYHIKGSSNVASLDGHMLYLKIASDTAGRNIDSCEIMHGQFQFEGSVDSVCIGNIYMDDEFLLPLVLEQGDIEIKLDNTVQSVSGTALNDSLSSFRDALSQLQSQMQELAHDEYQGYANNDDMEQVYGQLQSKQDVLNEQIDKLISGFVVTNFDNVLGPWGFALHVSGYEYPMLDAWVEDIMSKATDKFKKNAYIHEYYTKAQENQKIMNGTKDIPMAPPTPAPTQATPAPTPNELAQPKQ